MMSGFEHVPGVALTVPHPLAGREAYRCRSCGGIFYPPSSPATCPYCDNEDDDNRKGN